MTFFTTAEYQARVHNTKVSMERRGIDVLLITDPANMNYLTGYDGWSFYVHQMVVIFAEEPEPLWIGRKQDANGAKLTTWLTHRYILAYPEDYVQSEVHHPMDYMIDVLRQRGKTHAVIGVEKDAYYFTAMALEKLQQGLPDATLVDATLLVNWIRIVKSDAEIQLMRNAARIAEQTMKTAIETIAVGVRECDAAALVSHAQIKGVDAFGGDYPAIAPLMPSGKRTSASHLTWTDEPYRDGEIVVLELSGCHRRYHSPLARTVVLGKPSEALKGLADVVKEGIDTALDAVMPGVTCHDVEHSWRQVIESKGYTKDSRLGYAVGMNYPPDWGEHTASLRPGDRTILQPNMTFHMIAGIWLDEFGFELSETIRVTETGCETLTQFPRKLFVN